MRIGVVGYSAQEFDEAKAYSLFEKAIEQVIHELLGCDPCQVVKQWRGITIVSGLTNIGIPSIAYDYADSRNAKTMGIACSKAKDYECFPCDRVHIIGSEWGDESEAFLASIDVLIRVGGGKQSLAECAAARALGIQVFEQELDAMA